MGPELIDFEEEELEELSVFEENTNGFGNSIVSTETEKRGGEVKKKVRNFLKEHEVPDNI